jgi:integrase
MKLLSPREVADLLGVHHKVGAGPIFVRRNKKGYNRYYLDYIQSDGQRVQSAVDINTIRCILGHRDLSTTQRYVHSGKDEARCAVNRLVQYMCTEGNNEQEQRIH